MKINEDGADSGSAGSRSNLLLTRAQGGDARAFSALMRRHLPVLRRWAHGRLPGWLRTVLDTGDLVQNAVLQTYRRIHKVDLQGHAALASYLRQAVMNQIRDEHRRFKRRGASAELSEDLPDPGPSPLDHSSVSEIERSYRAALRALSESDQELIVAYVELGYSHQQLGVMTGRTGNAARVALRRALARLTAGMPPHGE